MSIPGTVQQSPLGKDVEQATVYTPSLLFAIPRRDARQRLGMDPDSLPFRGVDLWTAYEVSWLDKQGKPQVAVALIEVPADSENLIESKSFKLYLNSFNQTKFGSITEVAKTIELDLSINLKGPVMVNLMAPQNAGSFSVGNFAAESIDGIEVHIERYTPDASLLSADAGNIVAERLCSDLFRSCCPVTGQPDWASIYISYHGPAIDNAGLLAYLVSYREHTGLHEQCVEQIFLDIQRTCQPEALTVYARFLRRGGLDINPFRTNASESPDAVRLLRQ